MTDSSANPRNYGERPLHEDDPLMELSRIMDFGASADNNVARSEYRPEPGFDSGDDALSISNASSLVISAISQSRNSTLLRRRRRHIRTRIPQNPEPQLQEDDLASA
ncbi:hypothetical protein HED51_00050 [Ochrobactrum grignonense]|nr:hypothetical protein [Brucella grignonensis]